MQKKTMTQLTNFFLATIFLLLGQYSNGQTIDSTNNSSAVYEFASYDIIYSQKLLYNSFNKLNTLSNYSSNNPIQLIGLGSGGSYSHHNNKAYAYLSYSRIVPTNLILNDTLTVRTTGYIFNLNRGWDILRHIKNVDLLLTIGFNVGQLRLYQNDIVSKKNPFFAPNISLQPRFKIGRIALSFIGCYGLDISKTNWKNTRQANDSNITLDNLNQSGLMISFALGYIFVYGEQAGAPNVTHLNLK